MEASDYGVATISTITADSRRLKREDCSRTKHDSAFSKWKTLVGPSDWGDHAQRNEGAEKYRVKNLPNCTSCPGVYELGIVLSHHRSGRENRKLNPDFIIPVYLGKSDNVRNRLQQYGRDGAHLENGSSNCKLNDCNDIVTGKGPGPKLFSEIFTKCFSIVYRWTPMTNPREAEKTEADLLRKYDYAWNKGSNGPRRQNDILQRIDRYTKTPQFLQKLQLFPQRRKGVKIEACKVRPLLEDPYNFYTDFPPDYLSRVLKFGISRPMLGPWRSGIDEYCPSICGVDLGHGVVCNKPPSEGRKRCAEHKGMKINATSLKVLVERKFTLAGSSPQSLQVKKEYTHGPILEYNSGQSMLPNKAGRLRTSSGEQVAAKDRNIICGVDLDDGTFCTMQPTRGRKRCEEHKGIRVKEAGSKSFTEEMPGLFDNSGAKSCVKEEKKNAFLPLVFSDKSSPTCRMTLKNGGFCSRMPVEGNKRCWQHKGMRVDANSGSSTCYKSEYHNTAPRYSSFRSVCEDTSQTCGAPLQNGSYCRRRSNGICSQHRVDACSGRSAYYLHRHNTASTYSSYDSVYDYTSQTCGAPLRNGSYCRRRSTGPCWQHRG